MLPIIFALTSAFLWALVAILFKNLGNNILPLGMNLGKGIIASFLLGILVLFIDHKPVSNHAFLFLAISGLLGIALGDTFYFESLIRLGPRPSLVIATLIPVVTMLLAIVILHESYSLANWLGIFLTLCGVFLVLWDRSLGGYRTAGWKSGIQYGVLTVLCCSLGIICSKIVLESVSSLKATFIRQISGVIGLMFWGLFGLKFKIWIKPLFNDYVLLKKLFFASFIGTFLGTWFCILALKYTNAAIATTLNATSPLFILPLSFFILREKMSFRAIIGSFIAVAGVGLIFLGG
jgi:drug/metabolite transporter (DMT)-like permease